MDKEKNIDKLYEKYTDEFKRSKEYQEASENLANKFSEMQTKFTEEQLKDVEEFEQCLMKLLSMEAKDTFVAGFRAAIELEKETKED